MHPYQSDEPNLSLDALASRWRREADEVLVSLIGRSADVALLDAPYHDNFGDAAIWLGEVEWLRRIGARRRYNADIGRYDASELRRALPNGYILLHGGGNFGDFWPEHQQHREQVLRDFPDRTIVQLPQTIGFQTAEGRQHFPSVFEQHRSFYMLVRDQKSLDLGRSLRLQTILTHDAALNLTFEPAASCATADIHALLRTDHESTGLRPDHFRSLGIRVSDWILPWHERLRWFAIKIPPRVMRRISPGAAIRRPFVRASSLWYDAMARLMVRNATKQLSSAKVIITDRLHAHIIATLLRIPNVVLDNNYGKIFGVMEISTVSIPGVYQESNADQAVATARRLLRF